ncbi:MAG: FAD-dependent oxidoreductase [Candidatus Aenigmarchaeota archaeon]|nr:FAD-dependent oxidoreductase [Candidatus Aenigmarchaeota archaeon]
MKELYDIAIIGGGCAGFGAAMYAGRFQLKVVIFADNMGGTITLTDTVENYPGFKKLTGGELAEKLIEHAKDYKIDIVEEKVTDVGKKGKLFSLKTESGTFGAKTILFATGTIWRKLGVPGEKEFANRGVHYCALCDGAMYKNKVIGVVGGSDSAAKEALLLSDYGKKVYIIYRGENIRPEPVNMTRVENNSKIEIINRSNVKEIRGNKFVNRAMLDNPYKGKKELPLDALFIEIGHIPLSELAKKLGVKLNEKGEIIIDRMSRTNIEGVYAAGDVADTEFKQAITGVAEGVTAAYSAYKHLGESGDEKPKKKAR